MNGGARKDGVDGNLEGGNANSGRSSRLSREEINGDTDPSHAVPDVQNHETPTRTAPYILGTLHRSRIFRRENRSKLSNLANLVYADVS